MCSLLYKIENTLSTRRCIIDFRCSLRGAAPRGRRPQTRKRLFTIQLFLRNPVNFCTGNCTRCYFILLLLFSRTFSYFNFIAASRANFPDLDRSSGRIYKQMTAGELYCGSERSRRTGETENFY